MKTKAVKKNCNCTRLFCNCTRLTYKRIKEQQLPKNQGIPTYNTALDIQKGFHKGVCKAPLAYQSEPYSSPKPLIPYKIK